MLHTFTISPRVLAHLGEDLIRNESIAILELVKNAYDANAYNCDVDFVMNDEGEVVSIKIKDDGQGMSKQIVEDVWLVIGTDNKKDATPESGKRWPLGEKGIGRLGVHKLGRKIHMTTKTANDKEVDVDIDWNQLKTVSSIDEFVINVTENDIPKKFINGTTGTKIVIEDLKTVWNRRQLRSVYRDLNSLNSPFDRQNDSFKVNISSNNSAFYGLPDIHEILSCGMYVAHCRMMGRNITDFNYEFKPWESLRKVQSGRSLTIKDLHKEDLIILGVEEKKAGGKPVFYEVDLDQFKIGPIEFDVVIFERDRSIWNYVPIEKTSIDEYLRENGGIRVYRDNIRVYNYGERDNDWLGIDLQRIRRMGSHISNNIVVGAVKLDRSQSKGLREKTNREGFIEDEAYRAFTDAVNYALGLIVRHRIQDRDRFLSLYKTKATGEPVIEDLSSIVSIVEQKVENQEIKEDILKYVKRANEKYIEVRDILLKSANAGLNLSMVIHELEKNIASLKGYAQRGDTNQIIAVSRRLEELVRQHTVMLRKSEIKPMKLSKIVNTALSNYKFRFSDHDIKITTNTSYKDFVALTSEAESVGAVVNLLDNAIYWVSASRHDDRRIAVTLTDEIEGYHSIIVSDNGPGFNISTDLAIKPFITGKPHNYGMGLGLHVVNEIMRAVNGKLMFLEKGEIELPDDVENNQINNTVIALCFKKSV